MYDGTPCSSSSSVPGNVPFPLHQQVNFFNTAVVGIVQSFRQMLLHVRFEVLVYLSTLQQITVTEAEGGSATCVYYLLYDNYYILYRCLRLTVKFATTALGSSEKKTEHYTKETDCN